MFPGLFPLVSAVLLGQAPASAPGLKALPADTEVVVHVRGVSAARDDLLAMIRALSPTLADQVEPMITQNIDGMRERLGERLSTTPFLAAIKLPPADAAGDAPPFAMVIPGSDYEAMLKNVAGPGAEVKLEPQAGGYDAFADEAGGKIYAYKGDGFVAIGTVNDDVIKAIAAKPTATLDAKLSPELKAQIFAGDAGLYVDLEAVQTKYADQIEEARKSFADMMEQAAQLQGAPADQAEQAKKMVDVLITTLKESAALGLSVDFDAKAFDLSGLVTMRAGSKAAESLSSAQRGTGDAIAKLPQNSLMFIYMNVDPSAAEGLMAMNLANLGLTNQLGDQVRQASIDALKALGRQETYVAATFDKGMNIVSISKAERPEKAMALTEDVQKAASGSPLVKDVKYERGVLTYKGFSFNRATVTMDIEKMIQQQAQANPAAEQMIKAMLGGDTMTTYVGSDGKQLLSVTAKSDDELKAKVDSVLAGSAGVGSTSSFELIRSRLPRELSGMFLMNMQELIKLMASMLSSMTGAELQVPADMPKEPAMLGGSLSATPAGYRFDFVLPSAVGPVVEKGMVPMIQGLQGQVNQ
jgi:hypothetical protein